MSIEIDTWNFEEWGYLGEGLANVVCKYKGPNRTLHKKVLRIPKNRRTGRILCQVCRTKGINTERMLELLFSQLFGGLYSPFWRRLNPPTGFVDNVIVAIASQRPRFRVASPSSQDPRCPSCEPVGEEEYAVLLMEDLTQTPIDIGKHGGFSIEVKPKCGIPSDAEMDNRVTRFEMQQRLKVLKGEIDKISKFNPEVFFSAQSPEEVGGEVQELFVCPSNNLRVVDNLCTSLTPETVSPHLRQAMSDLTGQLVCQHAPCLHKIRVLQALSANIEELASSLANAWRKLNSACVHVDAEGMHEVCQECCNLHCWHNVERSMREVFYVVEAFKRIELGGHGWEEIAKCHKDYGEEVLHHLQTSTLLETTGSKKLFANASNWLRLYLFGRAVMDLSLLMNIVIVSPDEECRTSLLKGRFVKLHWEYTPEPNSVKTLADAQNIEYSPTTEVWGRLSVIDIDHKPVRRLADYAKQAAALVRTVNAPQ
eukprot:Platyproteum_vivax@DN1656_c0_g1_i1.p1